MERLWSSGVEAPWRADPAAALALVGLALLMRGLWFGAAGRPGLVRQGRDADAWIRCFQLAVAGLALLGLAAAWVWQLPWLLAIALSALGEEMVETSRILTAINRSPGRPPCPRTAAARRVTTSRQKMLALPRIGYFWRIENPAQMGARGVFEPGSRALLPPRCTLTSAPRLHRQEFASGIISAGEPGCGGETSTVSNTAQPGAELPGPFPGGRLGDRRAAHAA